MRRSLPSWRDWSGWAAWVLHARELLARVRARTRAHEVPVLLWLSAAILIHGFFPSSPIAEFAALEEGMVAQADVIAEISFQVRKGEAELLRERAEAAASVPPVFTLQPALADSAVRRLGGFFQLVDSLASAAPNEAAARRAAFATGRRHGLDFTEDQVDLLLGSRSRTAVRRAVERVFQELLPRGYAPSADLSEVTASRIVVRGPRGERLLPRDSVRATSRLYEAAAARLPSGFSLPEVQLFQALVVRFAEPTLVLDRILTEAAREQARAAVNPIVGEVLANERVIRAHERVRAQDIVRLRAYQQALSERGLGGGRYALGRVAGSLTLNLLVLLVLGLLVKFHRPELYGSPRDLGVTWGLIVLVMGVAGAVARADAPFELIPVALLGVSLAVLYGAPLAVAAVFTAAVLVAARPPFLGISALLTTWLAGAAAAMSVRVVRRRMQILGCGATITSAYLLAAACLGLLHATRPEGILFSTLLGAGNALVSASLAFVVFLPLLEKMTGMTTDLTLLELADMNHPLLRRLSLEAPGTYAHSINVANLAEAAAHAVGGNALLARVGAYYHDVGKLKRPHYFVENQHGRNPHDRLKPAISAAVVREHVVEGIELAREAGLPAAVRAFIPEHHGTGRIGFFYEKAQEEEPDARLDESIFRYPGPKPASKETAIALLADAVESATRALQDPTSERIRELIDRIVARRVEEGQLEDAPLTLHELQLIKAQFAAILTGMYHQRIDYPLTAEMASAEPQHAADRT